MFHSLRASALWVALIASGCADVDGDYEEESQSEEVADESEVALSTADKRSRTRTRSTNDNNAKWRCSHSVKNGNLITTEETGCLPSGTADSYKLLGWFCRVDPPCPKSY